MPALGNLRSAHELLAARAETRGERTEDRNLSAAAPAAGMGKGNESWQR
jgi:hypothetical protein